MLIAISTYFRLARYLGRAGLRTTLTCCLLLCCLSGNGDLLDMVTQRLYVERSRNAQRPWERPAAHRLIETDGGGVHISTPAGQRTAKIGDTLAPARHDTQQFVLGRSLPTSHTGAFRACGHLRPARHRSVYLPVPTSPLWGKNRTAVVVIQRLYARIYSMRHTGFTPVGDRPGVRLLPYLTR